PSGDPGGPGSRSTPLRKKREGPALRGWLGDVDCLRACGADLLRASPEDRARDPRPCAKSAKAPRCGAGWETWIACAPAALRPFGRARRTGLAIHVPAQKARRPRVAGGPAGG